MTRRVYARVADYLPSWVGWTVVILVVFGPPCALLISCRAVWSEYSANEAAREEREREAREQQIEFLRTEGSAVVQAFAAGQFKKDDPIEALFAAYPANGVVDDGWHIKATYNSDLEAGVDRLVVRARHGRLTTAVVSILRGPNIGRVTFFDDPGDLFGRSITDQLLQPYYGRGAAFKQGLLAVVGFAATIIPDKFPLLPPP